MGCMTLAQKEGRKEENYGKKERRKETKRARKRKKEKEIGRGGMEGIDECFKRMWEV